MPAHTPLHLCLSYVCVHFDGGARARKDFPSVSGARVCVQWRVRTICQGWVKSVQRASAEVFTPSRKVKKQSRGWWGSQPTESGLFRANKKSLSRFSWKRKEMKEYCTYLNKSSMVGQSEGVNINSCTVNVGRLGCWVFLWFPNFYHNQVLSCLTPNLMDHDPNIQKCLTYI